MIINERRFNVPGEETQVSFSLPYRDWLKLQKSRVWKMLQLYVDSLGTERIQKAAHCRLKKQPPNER